MRRNGEGGKEPKKKISSPFTSETKCYFEEEEEEKEQKKKKSRLKTNKDGKLFEYSTLLLS